MTRLAPALALVAAGCALLGPPRLADCPGPLVPVGAIGGGDFVLREKLRVRGPRVDASFELVAERRGDRLVLVGLDAFGARVFEVEQRGRDVTSASRLGRALAIPPENALRDLHAARFARPDRGGPLEVARAGCDYSARFVRIERRALR